MTPLDIFSVASGLVAVVRHYAPSLELPVRRRHDTEAAYAPLIKPPPATITKPAQAPPFPTGQSERGVYDQLSRILSQQLRYHMMSASTDADAKILQRYVELLGHIQRIEDDCRAGSPWVSLLAIGPVIDIPKESL